MPPRHFDDDMQRLAQRLADPLEPLMAQRLGTGGGGGATPGTPANLTTSWAGDAGTAGPACVISWDADADAHHYELTIDGITRSLVGTRYTYDLESNRVEHSGTPDYVLSISLVALSLGGSPSSAATATATNAAPASTALTAYAAAAGAQLTITAASAQDVLDYLVRVYKLVAGVATQVDSFYTAYTRPNYQIEDGDGEYQFSVTVRDTFGRTSTESSLTTAVFLGDPRSGIAYRDSLGTSAAILAALRDTVTTFDLATYPSGTSSWNWTEAIHTHIERVRKVYLSFSLSASYYLGISQDGVTYTFYSGGTTSGQTWEPVAQASEAAARTAAVTLTGGAGNEWTIKLPAVALTRYVKLFHQRGASSYAVRELYPRTYVEAGDIDVTNLNALSTLLGNITAGASATTIAGTSTTIQGDVAIASASGTLKFFGHPGGTRQTVTGSRGTNLAAVVKSLLDALHTYGIIIDSSTS